MTARRSLAAAVVSLALLAGCVTTGEVPDERFVRFVDELAFGPGIWEGRRARLARWDGPLDYSVVGTDDFSDAVADVMAAAARLAGVDDEPRRLSAGGLVFRQEPAGATFPVNRDRTDCFIRYRHAGDRIVGATIHIAATDAQRLRLCLYHEILHALGLGHSGVIASIMSPFHAVDGPTRWDAMAARFIMSDSVITGMSRAEVLARLVAELPVLRTWPDRLQARTDRGRETTEDRSS